MDIFKKKHNLSTRLDESNNIKQRYKGRIPIILEKNKSSDIIQIDKTKFIVPSTLTVGQFIYIVRHRIKLSNDKAIFIFVNSILPSTSELLSTIYEKHKDPDGFLYMIYSGESVFG
jgi:GABA(A) receptor-associated protein